MNEPTTLGADLRRERERRGIALRTISESTKVSLSLLEGLEADDISRWPGGIFRRAFVRSYAECVGLDADDVVRRFERQHPPPESELPITPPVQGISPAQAAAFARAAARPAGSQPPQRTRVLGTAADLAVASVIAFGFAAGGSRLLWPVLLIAAYYAIGILLTGTSPMVALLADVTDLEPRPAAPLAPADPPAARPIVQAPAQVRSQARRTSERPRQRRQVRA